MPPLPADGHDGDVSGRRSQALSWGREHDPQPRAAARHGLVTHGRLRGRSLHQEPLLGLSRDFFGPQRIHCNSLMDIMAGVGRRGKQKRKKGVG